MIKSFFLTIVISVSLNAEITLQNINSKPSGRAKNFMIWQYLKQDITPMQADSAYSQVEGNVHKIKKLYLKKSNNAELQKEIECRSEKDLLSISEKDCLKLAMSPYKTLSMDEESRDELIKRLESESAKNLVKIQAEPYSEKAYEPYDAKTVLTMFVSTTKKHRQENLNIALSGSFINSIFSEATSNWKKYTFIKIVTKDEKLDKLQDSLYALNGEYLDSESNFLLAMHNLKNSRESAAIKHFEIAKDKAKKRINADKNRFWLYLVSGDEEHLSDLLLSMDINIYTLYAKEKQGQKVDNYFSSVEITDKTSKKDICDPFVWNQIFKEIKETPKNELFKLANKYNQKDMASVQAHIIERAYGYKMHGFIMPYDEHLGEISNDEKALVYALMRQESYLVPSALSRSFALGLMQMMPFVTDDLSKRISNPIACYDDMFKPSYNIKYALKHLKWMKKSLYHPLFTAYAYNGGMGFLRRHLQTGTFSKGKYEPFMSMELMSNSESREYGKKVLSNYVMYKKILGEEVSIIDLLNNVTDPMKTDRFRSQG